MVQKSDDHQLRLVVHPIISNVFLHPRWLFGISEPSTVIVSSHPSKYFFFLNYLLANSHVYLQNYLLANLNPPLSLSLSLSLYLYIYIYIPLPHFSVAMFSKPSGKLHGILKITARFTPENNPGPKKEIASSNHSYSRAKCLLVSD